MAERPIFIGGMFKSGTSLLRAMIGQHPAIASGLETYWFDLNFSEPDSDELLKRLDQLADFYGFDHAEVRGMVGADSGSEAFLTRFLDAYAMRLGKPRWAEKTPGNVLHMDRIVAAWPQARIVHIIRDPRDVFASLRQARKWDSVGEFTDRWCAFFGAVERFRAELDLGPDRYLELRYEALVTAPAEATRELCAFVGEAWNEDMATFVGKSDDYDRVLSVTGKASTTLSRLAEPLSTGRVGIWRDAIGAAEIEAVRRQVDRRGLGDVFHLAESGPRPA
jgi:hypothetical protein